MGPKYVKEALRSRKLIHVCTLAAWNGAVSGCATGLALGWSQGPSSALQSCAMLGAFSYFLDGMAGGDDAAHAASSSAGRKKALESAVDDTHREEQACSIQDLLRPAIPLPRAVRSFSPCGINEGQRRR